MMIVLDRGLLIGDTIFWLCSRCSDLVTWKLEVEDLEVELVKSRGFLCLRRGNESPCDLASSLFNDPRGSHRGSHEGALRPWLVGKVHNRGNSLS